MSDSAALLEAVVAAPDDDAPRLVYADALQTAGNPRGELIAVQCELARLGCAPSDQLFLEWVGDELADDGGRVAKLRARESALLKKHGGTFEAECFPRGLAPPRAEFWRGFPERITWNLREAAEGSFAQLVARCPVSYLMLSNAKDVAELNAFVEAPAVERVRELYDIDGYGVAVYAAAPLPGLRRMILNHAGGPHQLDVLPRATWLSGLTGLVLGGFSLSKSVADVAATLARTTKLEELQLVDTRIGAAALRTLSFPKTVRVLGLRHAKLAAGEAAPILAKLGASLAALDLRTNKLGLADIEELAKGDAPLRVLALEKCGLADAMLAPLESSSLLARLGALDLRKNALTDDVVPMLAGAKRLRTLLIGGNDLTPKGKAALKESLPHTRIYA